MDGRMRPEPLVGGQAARKLGWLHARPGCYGARGSGPVNELRAGPGCCGARGVGLVDGLRASPGCRGMTVGMERQRSRAVRATVANRTARCISIGAVLQRAYS